MRALQHRNYRLFIVGQSVSLTGTWIQRVAQDWLVLDLTGSLTAVGIASALQYVPILLFGMWGGVVADRVDRRRLFFVTQAVQLAMAAALAALVYADASPVWVVYLFSLALGVVTVFDQPVRQSFVANLVDRRSYANAQVLNSTANNLGKFVGPAVAGTAIAVAGIPFTFALNAVSFLPVLVNLRRMDVSALHHREPVARARGQAREALGYVWRDPVLRTTFWLLLVVSLLGQNFRVVLPALTTEVYDGDAGTYGWLMALVGLGAVVTAVFSATREHATLRGVLMATLAFAVTSLAVAVAPTVWVAAAPVLLLGAANFAFNTLSRTVMQLEAVPSMHGRVMALHGLIFLGTTPIGGPLLGWVCEEFGARTGMTVAGLGCAVGALLALWVRRAGAVPVAVAPRAHYELSERTE